MRYKRLGREDIDIIERSFPQKQSTYTQKQNDGEDNDGTTH